MKRGVFFIEFTEDEARGFIEEIINACLRKFELKKGNEEQRLTIRQACKYMDVSAPTLRKFVAEGKIRRHDLGTRKKYFYLSELKEDIQSLSNAVGNSNLP